MKFEKTSYPGIYSGFIGKKKVLLTKNLTKGKTFFDEEENEGYRVFNPRHSKLAAAIVKRIKITGIKEGDNILYLGASHGYTPSFVSDIVGTKGFVFCLDFAPRVVRDLVLVCEKRENMTPILADANKPDTYKHRITSVDVIYQDIAQRMQVEILIKNLQFLKPKGYAIIAIKSRSIDVTKKPYIVFEEVENKLKKVLKIIDKKDLSPLEKDHMLFVCQKA